MAPKPGETPMEPSLDASELLVAEPPEQDLVGTARIHDIAEQGITGKTPAEAGDALAWFMADDETEEPVYPIRVNVGKKGVDGQWADHEIDWTVKPIPGTLIDSLRRQCQIAPNRAARRAGSTLPVDIDIARYNALLVFEATVMPDLREVLTRKNLADPAMLVQHRFRHKPLLVDQIAEEVLRISGGDRDDVVGAREVQAAGN